MVAKYLGMIKELNNNIDPQRIVEAYKLIEDKFDLSKPFPAVSITSLDGEDDWTYSTQKTADLSVQESELNVLNKSLKGSYYEELISLYPDFYRWRVLCMPGKRTYNVHQDSKLNQGNLSNIRIHIPMITNEQCFFQFWDGKPEANKQSIVRSYHLEVGKAYEVNTSNFHTAVNFGTEFRYHLIGVKYV